MVGDGGNQHIGGGHGFCQLGGRHGHIVQVQAGIEQFPHPRFHGFGQFAGDNDKGFLGGHDGIKAYRTG